jgi:CubicO group peptidase (beta-lactamase class C family)
VTKQVTAVLVMQEVERGRLTLDAPIAAYLPDFKGPTAAQVTVRQLLLHTSGLPNPAATAATPDSLPTFYLETGSRIGQLARTKTYCSGAPAGEPGAAFSYNNCDYLVLGALLEKVSGLSYATLINTRIARPLGLKTLRPAPDKLSVGYGALKGYESAGKPAPAMNIATLGAGGYLVGSAADMLAFDRALMAGKLVSTASLAELWKGDPKLGYAALGAWAFPAGLKGCADEVDLVERRGDFAGVQVRNIFAPKLGKVLVVFTNRSDLDFGEIWQGKGLSFDLLSAAFCPA